MTEIPGRVTVDIREGVVIFGFNGKRWAVDRSTTDHYTFNLGDHPDAEAPDEEVWTPFEEAEIEDGHVVGSAEWTLYKNSIYTVLKRILSSGVIHLSIRRNDRHWSRDWRHMQRIKNELCGPEYEGLELYPAESRVVDEANQYHLWVLPKGEVLPLGWNEGRMVSGPDGHRSGSTQRPFGGGHARVDSAHASHERPLESGGQS